jgi:hypothetical protein
LLTERESSHIFQKTNPGSRGQIAETVIVVPLPANLNLRSKVRQEKFLKL